MDNLLAKLEQLEQEFEITEAVITEDKKKKKPYSSSTVTTGSIPLNIDRFNKGNGTAIEPSATDEAEIADFLSGGDDTSGMCTAGDCGGGMAESLKEDMLYVSKLKRNIDLPDTIKLVSPAKVTELIKNLGPEDKFSVGYVTYLYCFKALEDFFTILKCTEFEGYTGIDWSDSEQLLKDGSKPIEHSGRKSTGYTVNNKLVAQKVVDKEETGITEFSDVATTSPMITTGSTERVVLDTILYYPATDSIPVVRYYVKLAGLDSEDKEAEYVAMDRRFLYDQIINKLMDAAQKFKEEQEKLPKSKRRANRFSTLLEPAHLDSLRTMLNLDADTSGEDKLDAKLGTSVSAKNTLLRPQVRALYSNQIYYIKTKDGQVGMPLDDWDTEIIRSDESVEAEKQDKLTESVQPLTEKRETKRYYIRPQDIFCANKADVLKALVDVYNAGENCSVYTLKNLTDHDDVHKLTNDDIIYTYDKGVLLDKNKVLVADYDLFIKHEEERGKVSDTGTDLTKTEWNTEYDDRMTQNTVVESLLDENYDFSTNGYLIHNVADYAKSYKYIVARNVDDELWFYGAWNEESRARACADELNAYGGTEAVAQVIKNTNIEANESFDPFNLTFEDYDVFGNRLVEGKVADETCVICGETIDGYGNNAEPYKKGKCCDACNLKFVIPARLERKSNIEADEDTEDKDEE